MKFRPLLLSAIGTLSLLLSVPLAADDTDIYYQTGAAVSGEAYLMFTLDYTPDLGSAVCILSGTDITTASVDCAAKGFDDDLEPFFLAGDAADGKISRFEMLRAVLKKVLDPNEFDGLHIGLMLTHDDQAGVGANQGKDSEGAYVIQGFVELDSEDVSNTAYNSFISKLNAIPDPQGGLSHENQNKEMYLELFRYLAGYGVTTAHMGWNDYNTSSEFNINEVDDTSPSTEASLSWDTSIEYKKNVPSMGQQPFYISPLSENCSKIFVFNVTGGAGNQANDFDTQIGLPLNQGGLQINVSNSDAGYVEMVQKLHDIDIANGEIARDENYNFIDLEGVQNVISYYLAIQPQQVHAAAAAGGTGTAMSFSDNAANLAEKIKGTLNEVLSVSTSFVSASIPVNVFNRSEVLDNVYIGVFQVEANSKPQWTGNVKKLKLAIDTIDVTVDGVTEQVDTLTLKDANNVNAIASDGRIKHDALTYWTSPSGWDVQNTYEDTDIAGKDGRSVNRGGAGQQQPLFLNDAPSETNSTGRKLFTEPASGSTLLSLNANAATAEAIWPDLVVPATGYWSDSKNLPTGTWATDSGMVYADANPSDITLGDIGLKLLKFMRGIDVNDADGDNSTSDARQWFFGDPLHSRPLPINYGAHDGHTIANPDVRIIVGSNDGFLRMIRNTTNIPSESGEELWAFMPRKVMAIQKQLMDNGVSGTPVHPYGVDGAPSVYVYDHDQDGTIETADGDKVWLFFGLRRGGRALYGMNISNPNSPSLLWSKDESDLGSELGYTFSTPKVGYLDYTNDSTDNPKPVLIFGGGYDLKKDDEDATVGTNDNIGNGIFVIDAESGDLVWKAVPNGTASGSIYLQSGLVDSIPSPVTAIDTTGNGITDRAYVGDTGGRVWRIDLNGDNTANWSATQLANLGRHNVNDKANDRRFFHAPDFVPAKDGSGAFDGVVIGSGDRADPLGTGADDMIYMIKDRAIASGAPSGTTITHSQLGDVTDNCIQDDPNNCTTSLTYGWRLELEGGGEKALASPLTITGEIFISTYQPATGSSVSGICTPKEGDGYLYIINLQDASAVNNFTSANDYDTDGDGTDDEVLGKDDRKKKLDSPGIPSENVYITFRQGSKRLRCTMSSDFTCRESGKKAAWRTFWYKKEE